MATNAPLMQPGSFVKYNATTQDPRAKGPAPQEQGLGVIKQGFTQSDGPYYQVVWNQGDANPVSALYHQDQLTSLSQQEAQQLVQQQNAGQSADTGVPGSQFQQPTLPTIALPPALQGGGSYSAGPPDQTNPSLTETA